MSTEGRNPSLVTDSLDSSLIAHPSSLVARPSALRVLDLGCGTGVVGLAALAAGHRVTFADKDATALQLAAENAELNGFADYELLELNWTSHAPHEQWDVVLAADVLDDDPSDAHVAGLVQFLLAAWSGNGPCWIADPGREGSRVLRRQLAAAGVHACVEEIAYRTEDRGPSNDSNESIGDESLPSVLGTRYSVLWTTWLWRIGEEPREGCLDPTTLVLPEPMRQPAAAPCRHRELEHVRLVECATCGPSVHIKVFPCEVHGECTLQKPIEGIQCCATCPDYEVASNER